MAFSKLRSAAGGIYAWRAENSKKPEERERMLKEADYAFRQAFAMCPYSPEAVYRYTNLLRAHRRTAEAVRLVSTALKVVPEDVYLQALLRGLNRKEL